VCFILIPYFGTLSSKSYTGRPTFMQIICTLNSLFEELAWKCITKRLIFSYRIAGESAESLRHAWILFHFSFYIDDNWSKSRMGNCFGSGGGGHFGAAEVGGGPHLLKWLHSLVNFAFHDTINTLLYSLYYQRNILLSILHWPPLWSSGQSSWLQIRRPGLDSRHYKKKKVVGLERGPLSLVSTTEELLDRKVAAPV
jgi:hypothetical protein